MASLLNKLGPAKVPELEKKKFSAPESGAEKEDAATRFEAVALPFAQALYNKALY